MDKWLKQFRKECSSFAKTRTFNEFIATDGFVIHPDCKAATHGTSGTNNRFYCRGCNVVFEYDPQEGDKIYRSPEERNGKHFVWTGGSWEWEK